MTQDVLILAGPTASGKSELAVALAERFDAEIVGADSRQIYRGMPIGTAMPSPEQLAAVPHHLVDFLDPNERYSAARYADDALEVVLAIARRGKRAIVVGGTGFYLRALIGGVSLAPEYDPQLRARLAAEARIHPPEFLHAWLALADPRRASELAPGDTYRVLRALEIARAGAPAAPLRPRRSLASEGIAFLFAVLDLDLALVDERIRRRTQWMLDNGLLEEAERIGIDAVAASAVGYPQALAYLNGWSTRGELVQSLVRATARYARRQRSWFRSEPAARWLPPGAVEAAVRENLRWCPKLA